MVNLFFCGFLFLNLSKIHLTGSSEGVKQKNLRVEARNRRVLQDIGNLVTTRAAEGKQAPAEKNKVNLSRLSCAFVYVFVSVVSQISFFLYQAKC